jgi:hypothetical protein
VKNYFFCDDMPRNLMDVQKRSTRKFYHDFRILKASRKDMLFFARSALIAASCFIGLHLDPEDGGRMFLLNVGHHLPEHMDSYHQL